MEVYVRGGTGSAPAELAAVVAGVNDVCRYIPGEHSIRESLSDIVVDGCLAQTTPVDGMTEVKEVYWAGVAALILAHNDPGDTPIDVPATVFVILPDLSTLGANWIYGAAETAPVRLAILSVHRLRLFHGGDAEALRRIARHELGHALGLIPDSRAVAVDGALGRHCTNVCTMRQVDMLGWPTLATAVEEELAADALFCELCSEFLRSVQP